MNDLVSVIINVYNCKEYLPYSLESVRQQTYKNLEVILVEDASTDGSGEFCDEFCKQDERFRVIHHEKNTGVSGPRNTGLKAAKGNYIYFMDSDDYIHVEMIERLYNAIQETGIELAACDYSKTSSLTNNIYYTIPDYKYELVPEEQMIFEMIAHQGILRWRVVWNKLYKRSLIDGLLFNDATSIQDQDFNIRVYMRSRQAAYIPESMYWYFNNPNSLQRDTTKRAKRLYFNTMYNFKMLNYLSKKGKEKKYRAWILDYGYRRMLQWREDENDTEYESLFKEMAREILKSTQKEFVWNKYISLRKKVRFLFYWYCPKLANVYVKKFYG